MPLRGRELVGQNLVESLHEVPGRVVLHAGGLGLHPRLAKRDPQLEREELVELEAFAGRLELLLRAGEVDGSDGRVERGQRLVLDDGRGHRIRDLRKLQQRPVDELPDRPSRDAVGRRMNGVMRPVCTVSTPSPRSTSTSWFCACSLRPYRPTVADTASSIPSRYMPAVQG